MDFEKFYRLVFFYQWHLGYSIKLWFKHFFLHKDSGDKRKYQWHYRNKIKWYHLKMYNNPWSNKKYMNMYLITKLRNFHITLLIMHFNKIFQIWSRTHFFKRHVLLVQRFCKVFSLKIWTDRISVQLT